MSDYGFYATPDIHFDKEKEKGRPFAYHTCGAALTEVEVDVIRGRYKINSVRLVHDLGRAIHEQVDIGQVEGGLAQGLGWMTLEELLFADDGRLLSGALGTYKVPDAHFMPDDLQVHFLEDSDEPIGPYGSKAVGEPPLMYGIGVYFALMDAMRAANPNYADSEFAAPMTPERVMMGIHGADDPSQLPTR